MTTALPLSTMTTLGLGGPAPELLIGDSDDALCAAVAGLDAAGRRVLLVAGGSNLVISDDGINDVVVRVANRGVVERRDGADLIVDVAAGEPWDDLVARTVDEGWAGLESLSGIPGSTGATPIQNVGAYGVETAACLEDIVAFDRRTRTTRVVAAADLELGYRTSALRGRDELIVVRVRFRLTRTHTPVRYAELAAALGVAPGQPAAPAEIRAAVLELRRGKGMVVDPADPDTRSVGSFFTNPLLRDDELARTDALIRVRFGDDVRYPRYPAGERTKLSAAWLIERAGIGKGFALPGSGAAVSTKHTLALVNRDGTTADLLALARHIRDVVRDAFAVDLHPEPILVGVTF